MIVESDDSNIIFKKWVYFDDKKIYGKKFTLLFKY